MNDKEAQGQKPNEPNRHAVTKDPCATQTPTTEDVDDINGTARNEEQEAEKRDTEWKHSANSNNDNSPKNFKHNRAAIIAAAGALIALVAVSLLFATHIICFHEHWASATCTEPRHCVDCGKTEGEALGHDWIAATCSEPKTCMRCGATEGEAIGHKTKEWSAPTIDIASAQEKSTLKCEVCGEIVDEKSTSLTSFIREGRFIFSPSGFCERLRNEIDMEAIDGSDSELISYALTESVQNPEMVAMLSFSTMDGQTNLGESYKYDSSCNPSPVLMVDTEKTNSADMMVGFVQACDPSLTHSDAVRVAMELADSINGANGSTEKNGIEYLLAGIDHRVLFRAVIK